MKEYSKLPILIIEDDKLYATKLASMLATFTNQITISASAENGSHFVSQIKPSVIFLDNKLPKLQGNDVIELYKSISPSSKVILMSSVFTVDEIALAIQRKADYIFEKSIFKDKELKLLMDAIIKSDKVDNSIWRILKIFEPNTRNIRKIAIVEDDELFSFHLSWMLREGEENLNVNSFSNGTTFINDLKEISPDVIFLDYHLPDMTGNKILAQINKSAPSAKVIVISSQDDIKIATDLKAEGIYGYIVKNADWKEKVNEYRVELGF